MLEVNETATMGYLKKNMSIFCDSYGQHQSIKYLKNILCQSFAKSPTDFVPYIGQTLKVLLEMHGVFLQDVGAGYELFFLFEPIENKLLMNSSRFVKCSRA